MFGLWTFTMEVPDTDKFSVSCEGYQLPFQSLGSGGVFLKEKKNSLGTYGKVAFEAQR